MSAMKISVRSVAILVSLALLTGCAPTTERPDTTGVTGTVTLNGEAVEGAVVTFVPTGDGQSAVGKTDASGKYALTTFGGGDGAVTGEYAVKISKYAAPEAAAGGGEEEGEYEEDADDTGEQVSLLPEIYADEGTSNLTASVSEGSTTFDFALEGEAPAKE